MGREEREREGKGGERRGSLLSRPTFQLVPTPLVSSVRAISYRSYVMECSDAR